MSPDLFIKSVVDELSRGGVDSKHPFRFFTIATRSREKVDQRMVVRLQKQKTREKKSDFLLTCTDRHYVSSSATILLSLFAPFGVRSSSFVPTFRFGLGLPSSAFLLHALNPAEDADNAKATDQALFVTKLEENKKFFAPREFERAKKACNPCHAVGPPSVPDFKSCNQNEFDPKQ